MFNKRKEAEIVAKLKQEHENKDRKNNLIKLMGDADIIRQGIDSPFWKLLSERIESETLPESKNLRPENIIAMTADDARVVLLINSYKDIIIKLPYEIVREGDEAEKAYKKDYAKEDGTNA